MDENRGFNSSRKCGLGSKTKQILDWLMFLYKIWYNIHSLSRFGLYLKLNFDPNENVKCGDYGKV